MLCMRQGVNNNGGDWRGSSAGRSYDSRGGYRYNDRYAPEFHWAHMCMKGFDWCKFIKLKLPSEWLQLQRLGLLFL